MAKTVTAGFELDDLAHKAVDNFATAKGMHKKQVVSRVMRWFAHQVPMVQSAVAGLVDPGAEKFYAKSLRTLADEIERNAEGGDEINVLERDSSRK